jgi:hypothetical protein
VSGHPRLNVCTGEHNDSYTRTVLPAPCYLFARCSAACIDVRLAPSTQGLAPFDPPIPHPSAILGGNPSAGRSHLPLKPASVAQRGPAVPKGALNLQRSEFSPEMAAGLPQPRMAAAAAQAGTAAQAAPAAAAAMAAAARAAAAALRGAPAAALGAVATVAVAGSARSLSPLGTFVTPAEQVVSYSNGLGTVSL